MKKMATAMILMGCICLLSACDRKPKPFPEVRTDVRYDIVQIEECEYITFGVHGFSHKGNCKNPIHTVSR